jgi:hypothetical protein
MQIAPWLICIIGATICAIFTLVLAFCGLPRWTVYGALISAALLTYSAGRLKAKADAR